MKKNILVTGGAGYIGSHMVRCLLENKYRPIVLDNLSTGSENLLPKNVCLINADLRSKKEIDAVFKKYSIGTVMHFAASISVPQSIKDPLGFYENNVSASINLVRSMHDNRIHQIIFSSTAAVYGNPANIPIHEHCPVAPLNPYGRSKAIVENLLADAARTTPLRYIIFRYFNACGAHPSWILGRHNQNSSHLLSTIFRVLKGRLSVLPIYGTDYLTPDGTCIRDYVHVMDICGAHLLALSAFDRGVQNEIFNLGSGKGFSVKETVQITEKVSGTRIPTKSFKRRRGDPAISVASCSKAEKLLGWKPAHDLISIVESARRWEESAGK